MKKHYFLLALTILLISFTAKAQEKWSVEFRPSLNFPVVDVNDTQTKMGFGYEVTGSYNIMPHLAAYAGWGWNQFKGKDNHSADNFTFEESGFTFGFQIIRQIGTSPFSYLARAGAVYNRIKLENNAGDVAVETSRGLGWQIAAGIDYEFAYNLSLRPMIRYRSLSGDYEFESVSNSIKLNYISFGIGLAVEF